MDQTLLFMIGAQKCGTRWLARQLSRHPAINAGRPKEMHSWTVRRRPYRRKVLKDIAHRASTSEGRRARMVQRRRDLLQAEQDDHAVYLKLLRARGGPKPKPVTVDVTLAHALLGADTYAEMAALVPNTRFADIMRDPFQRPISEARSEPVHPRKDPEETLARRLDMRLGHLAAPRGSDDLAQRHRADYDATIRALETAVPRDRITYLVVEDLVGAAKCPALDPALGLAQPLQPNPAARSTVSTCPGWCPSDVLADRVYTTLAPIYAFVRERFGDAVPAEWAQPHVSQG